MWTPRVLAESLRGKGAGDVWAVSLLLFLCSWSFSEGACLPAGLMAPGTALDQRNTRRATATATAAASTRAQSLQPPALQDTRR